MTKQKIYGIIAAALVSVAASSASAAISCAVGEVLELKDNGLANERAGVYFCISRGSTNGTCARGWLARPSAMGYTCAPRGISRSLCRVNGRNSAPVEYVYRSSPNMPALSRFQLTGATRFMGRDAFAGYVCNY